MQFNNSGRSSITLNVLKMDGQVKNVMGSKLIAMGSGLYIEIEKESKAISSVLAKGEGRSVPIEAHFENEIGKHFVFHGALFFVWENDKVVVHGQTVSILPEP